MSDEHKALADEMRDYADATLSGHPQRAQLYSSSRLNPRSLSLLLAVAWFGFISWLFVQDNRASKLDTGDGLLWFGAKAGIYTAITILATSAIWLVSKIWALGKPEGWSMTPPGFGHGALGGEQASTVRSDPDDRVAESPAAPCRHETKPQHFDTSDGAGDEPEQAKLAVRQRKIRELLDTGYLFHTDAGKDELAWHIARGLDE